MKKEPRRHKDTKGTDNGQKQRTIKRTVFCFLGVLEPLWLDFLGLVPLSAATKRSDPQITQMTQMKKGRTATNSCLSCLCLLSATCAPAVDRIPEYSPGRGTARGTPYTPLVIARSVVPRDAGWQSVRRPSIATRGDCFGLCPRNDCE